MVRSQVRDLAPVSTTAAIKMSMVRPAYRLTPGRIWPPPGMALTLRVYVNGIQATSKALGQAMVTTTSPLRIGGNSTWGEYFAGKIDEVRVYNRALSSSEIQADMNTALP